MTRTLARFWLKALVAAALLCPAFDRSQAQTMNNPLVGAWNGGSADGSIAGTDLYSPDGMLVSTASVRVGSGTMLVRSFSRYRLQQVGPNQIQVEMQMVSYLPRQMCTMTPGGSNCQPFTLSNPPTSMTVTFLDQNTIQANGIVSRRDGSPGFGQLQVPEVAMVQGGGGGGGGGGGVVSTCTLGSTVCDMSGWRKVCERWPAGNTDWMQHGVRCRNGYGQPEF